MGKSELKLRFDLPPDSSAGSSSRQVRLTVTGESLS